MRRVLLPAVAVLVTMIIMAGIASAIDLSSPAFKANEKIAVKFSCDGQNINPALNFSNIPAQSELIGRFDKAKKSGQ